MKKAVVFVLFFSVLSVMFFNCSKVAFNQKEESSEVGQQDVAADDVVAPAGTPELLISETQIIFGDVTISSESVRSFKITNKTGGALTVEDLSAAGTGAAAVYALSSKDCGSNIQKGKQISKNASCTIDVKFIPNAKSQFNKDIIIKFKEWDEKKVILLGNGVDAPVLGKCKAYPQGTKNKPSGNVCDAGSPSTVIVNTSLNKFEWTCQGTGNNSLAVCGATYTPYEVCLDYGQSYNKDIGLRHIDGTTTYVRECKSLERGINCNEWGPEGAPVCCGDNNQISYNRSCLDIGGEGHSCRTDNQCSPTNLSCRVPSGSDWGTCQRN